MITPVPIATESTLADESRLVGEAQELYTPGDTEQLAKTLAACAEQGRRVTLQGARTGLSGGAAPAGGAVVSLLGMDRVLSFDPQAPAPTLRVQAGVTLETVAKTAAAKGLFFPPNPTEATATAGGLFASGGAGPSSLRFGPTSHHVAALRWVCPGGAVWDIQRGAHRFDETGCPLPDGRRLALPTHLPETPLSAGVPRPGLDLIDLLAGSEGRLGAAAELTLALCPQPAGHWGVVFYFRQEAGSLAFLKGLQALHARPLGALLDSADYCEAGALAALSAAKEKVASMAALPPLHSEYIAAYFLELSGEDPALLEEALGELLALSEQCGGLDEDSWAEDSPAGIDRMRAMRHALPELVPLAQPGAALRLESDFGGPPQKADETLGMYREGLAGAGLEGMVYGHILQNRLHVAPRCARAGDEQAALSLFGRWAAKLAQDGGLLACENGLGRTRAALVLPHLSEEQRQARRALKDFFDPEGLFGPREAE